STLANRQSILHNYTPASMSDVASL
ncbi:hypothetical protein AZ020_004682, partial [Enterobacter hormaechei]